MANVEREPQVDSCSGTYFRKGKCVVCGKQAERTRTITASSYDEMQRRAKTRESRPLMHKKCERTYLGEEEPW